MSTLTLHPLPGRASSAALSPSAAQRRPDGPPRRAVQRRESDGDSRGALRLTRRGRVVLFFLALVAVVIAFSVGRVSVNALPSGPTPRVTVHLGDTLWGVASTALPRADPRAAVARVAALNHLDEEAPLRAGQVLVLPRG